MNFSKLFIERPVMTALVMLAILLFGIVGYRALPVAALPSVDYPTIQVNASVPGATPALSLRRVRRVVAKVVDALAKPCVKTRLALAMDVT